MQDLLEGKKEIYGDLQYFPEGEPQEMPPPSEYDEDEEIDYALGDEDLKKVLKRPEMTPQKLGAILIAKMQNTEGISSVKGYKSSVTKDFKSGKITEAERQMRMRE